MHFIGSKEVHFSLAGTVIKYSFVFHILDDMPKAVIKCVCVGGGSFILFCCSLSWKPFQYGQKKGSFARCLWKHSVVEMLWAWTLFDTWFLGQSLHSSSTPLHLISCQTCHSLIAIQEWFFFFFSELVMSNHESPSTWAISCRKLIWTDFRDKGSVDGVYPAYSLLLCSMKFVMNISGVLPLQNWKEEVKKM